jgi:hypothetical protein
VRAHTHNKMGGRGEEESCATLYALYSVYNKKIRCRGRISHTATHCPPTTHPRQLTAFSIVWQPSTTSVSGHLATPLSPAPHTFSCFLLCTRFRSLQKVCTSHTRFFVTKYITRVLALGAVWLAKGPKISGQSYYSYLT